MSHELNRKRLEMFSAEANLRGAKVLYAKGRIKKSTLDRAEYRAKLAQVIVQELEKKENNAIHSDSTDNSAH